ncbi:hypothetical protein Nepgr_004060 [Nepenthes gracilis]|uniref:Uncharacterized protein n=1 Tax=Nepenthes gracilis TaxID=150966 RepID=A0AAD3XEU5_NEPGR|nr:hypothetical protein Nepgr_004060 [Nepenthes gracilis]
MTKTGIFPILCNTASPYPKPAIAHVNRHQPEPAAATTPPKERNKQNALRQECTPAKCTPANCTPDSTDSIPLRSFNETGTPEAKPRQPHLTHIHSDR